MRTMVVDVLCRKSILCGALALFFARQSGAQTSYIVTDLGSIRTAPYSRALGISSSGLIVGTAAIGAYDRPALYLASGVVDLGTLGGLEGIAYGANSSGYVVGHSTNGTGNRKPCRWDPAGNIVDLGTLGGPYGRAIAINNGGAIVGFSHDGNREMATLWQNGAAMSLGHLGDGSQAWAINNKGHVAGFSSTGSGFLHAFIWTPEAGMKDLWTQAISFTEAYGINDFDVVVGHNGSHAIMWSPTTGLQDLGTLGGSDSAARAVNNLGVIVGVSHNVFQDTKRAFVYSNGKMRDLNYLIPANSPFWILDEAYAINDAGQIVGSGINNGGYRHAYLLTPVNVDLLGVSISPTTIVGGNTATGKITLTAKTPSDLPVSLTNTTPGATMPSTVIVPAGASVAYFYVNTSPVITKTNGTVTATLGTTSKSLTLAVRPIGVKSLRASPTTLTSGTTATCTVTLERPAAPGAIVVTLSSTKPTLVAPTVASITIPEGATTGTFTIKCETISVATTAQIKASANGITKGVTLTLNP